MLIKKRYTRLSASECAGSVQMIKVFKSFLAKYSPALDAQVVLPTPPFPPNKINFKSNLRSSRLDHGIHGHMFELTTELKYLCGSVSPRPPMPFWDRDDKRSWLGIFDFVVKIQFPNTIELFLFFYSYFQNTVIVA